MQFSVRGQPPVQLFVVRGQPIQFRVVRGQSLMQFFVVRVLGQPTQIFVVRGYLMQFLIVRGGAWQLFVMRAQFQFPMSMQFFVMWEQSQLRVPMLSVLANLVLAQSVCWGTAQLMQFLSWKCVMVQPMHILPMSWRSTMN